MKKVNIAFIALILIVISALVYADVNIHQLKTIPSKTAADILPASERDCFPNQYSTPTVQAKIVTIAKEMAQFNNEKNNTTDPQLQALTQQYNQEIAKFDICTINTN